MRIALTSMAALLACAACQTADTAQYDMANIDSDGEELICKKVRVTGELVPREICKTRAQIEEENKPGTLTAGAIASGQGSDGGGRIGSICNGKGAC